MAIGTAIQKGTHVWVYDEDNRLLFNRQGELMGYTARSISLNNGSFIIAYNEKKINSFYKATLNSVF